MMKKIFVVILYVCLGGVILYGGYLFGYEKFYRYKQENALLKSIVTRLEADSKVAEVLVTDVVTDQKTGQQLTTIKFLEYGTNNKPLKPKYFTFSGNILQFQSLVIRFEDMYVRHRDEFRGKSAFIFWKVFRLDGSDTEEYEINPMNEIPLGYKLPDKESPIERSLWTHFWQYALDHRAADKKGIKSAQIEAPGTRFVPGYLYTLKIEHDGGLRIDANPLSRILRGELIP